MALDYAVNEAAKEIAAAAYPISFVNELEDEKLQEYGNTKYLHWRKSWKSLLAE